MRRLRLPIGGRLADRIYRQTVPPWMRDLHGYVRSVENHMMFDRVIRPFLADCDLGDIPCDHLWDVDRDGRALCKHCGVGAGFNLGHVPLRHGHDDSQEIIYRARCQVINNDRGGYG